MSNLAPTTLAEPCASEPEKPTLQTPPPNRGRLRGVHLWVALPDASLSIEASFESHRALPSVELDGGRATVIVGELAGARSPQALFRRSSEPISRSCRGARSWPRSTPASSTRSCRSRAGAGSRITGSPWTRSTTWAAAAASSAWRRTARPRACCSSAARDDWENGRRFGEVRAYAGARLPAPPFLARPVPH